MLKNTSPKLIHEWLEFSELAPFGDIRADMRNAILISTIVNLFCSKNKKVKIEDYMPNFEFCPDTKTSKEMEKLVEGIFSNDNNS